MSYPAGPIAAQGCFTADFGLAADVPVAQVPAVIEQDRAVMAMRPGMRQKHLPVAFDESTARFVSGGRYLFDTFEHAAAYREWAANEFVVDGTKFFERPYFIDPVFFAWRVIGAHDFKPIADAHKVIRFGRGRRSDTTRSRATSPASGCCTATSTSRSESSRSLTRLARPAAPSPT
jgi:hypothetical protein